MLDGILGYHSRNENLAGQITQPFFRKPMLDFYDLQRSDSSRLHCCEIISQQNNDSGIPDPVNQGTNSIEALNLSRLSWHSKINYAKDQFPFNRAPTDSMGSIVACAAAGGRLRVYGPGRCSNTGKRGEILTTMDVILTSIISTIIIPIITVSIRN